ncbi:MAG: dual specificity protein phosphatase [Rhodospirillaceae bacterium]
MFEIRVSGLAESGRLRREWATRTIGLFDPDNNCRPGSGAGYFQECFFDLEDATPPALAPSLDAIRRILDHAAGFEPADRVLVHCTAGISRSTAVAILLLVRHGMAPGAAFAHVARLRPAMSPNMLIVEHGERLLGLNGRLKRAYLEWHRAALGRGPADE